MRELIGEDEPLLGDVLGAGLKQRAFEAWVVFGDAGPATAAHQRGHIGRRVYRARGTQAPGSGLGLSIVQPILDLRGGGTQLHTLETGSGCK